jgi:molecular chaperone HscA
MGKISINIASATIELKKYIIGIDLGTTNSLVAYVPNGETKPVLVKINDQNLVPSIVYFNHQSEPLVGMNAKLQLADYPERTIFSVKRLLGKNYAELLNHAKHIGYSIIDDNSDNLVKVEIDGKFYNPIQLSSFILKELKSQAEKKLNVEITQAVITVPAYFNDTQRQATRDAGKLAGLDVLRIMNEPTAAALAYGESRPEEVKTILVYDLGGGTFDVSIVQLENGIFEVLSTHGDTYLGGDDIDKGIVDFWLSSINGLSETQKEILRPKWRVEAENAKINLSNDSNTPYLFSIILEGEKFELVLNASNFNEIVKPLIAKTKVSVIQALKDATLNIPDIQEVVLVGGSTRLPQVGMMLREFFPNVALNNAINPDEVVALGAAIEADILAGNRTDILLLDVTPLSLGIETAGGLMDVIIPRNAKIPTRVAREYTTSVDGQVNLKISVFQGERELVAENRELGTFILKNIPPMPAGFPKIEIQFALNADGMLKVLAKELRSGVEQQIDIQPTYGLTDQQVEEMLLAGLEHAQSDIEIRLLQEAKNEATQIIYTTEKFIQNHGKLLNELEISETLQFVNELKLALEITDRHAIQQKIEALNEFTRPFAERIMDIAVSQALKGNNISSL